MKLSQKMKDEMRAEALSRMTMLHLHPNVIHEFSQDGELNYSDCSILYWLRNKPNWLKIVRDWEAETNFLAYHVIFSETNFGDMLTILYISDKKNEWEFDREDLKEHVPCAYVINLDMPECSEYGSVEICEIDGGLVRIA